MAQAVYEELADGTVFATELARGPWDRGAQHGGAPAAMLVRAFERAAGAELQISRLTFELLRPVSLGELALRVDVLRAGHRVQLLEGTMIRPDGTELVRARALMVARSEVEAGPNEPAPPGPDQGRPNEFDGGGVTTFPGDAMELRFVNGSFYTLGPATAWFRLRVPLVAGEEPSPLQRLAAAADFPNGISTPLSWQEYVFINPDLTITVEREPVGEWICLERGHARPGGGVGSAEAVLYDQQGASGARSSRCTWRAKVRGLSARGRATSSGRP